MGRWDNHNDRSASPPVYLPCITACALVFAHSSTPLAVCCRRRPLPQTVQMVIMWTVPLTDHIASGVTAKKISPDSGRYRYYPIYANIAQFPITQYRYCSNPSNWRLVALRLGSHEELYRPVPFITFLSVARTAWQTSTFCNKKWECLSPWYSTNKWTEVCCVYVFNTGTFIVSTFCFRLAVSVVVRTFIDRIWSAGQQKQSAHFGPNFTRWRSGGSHFTETEVYKIR